MLGKTLAAVALLAGNAAAKIFYAGVAESGGEFGVWSKPSPNGISSATRHSLTITRRHSRGRIWSPRNLRCGLPVYR